MPLSHPRLVGAWRFDSSNWTGAHFPDLSALSNHATMLGAGTPTFGNSAEVPATEGISLSDGVSDIPVGRFMARGPFSGILAFEHNETGGVGTQHVWGAHVQQGSINGPRAGYTGATTTFVAAGGGVNQTGVQEDIQVISFTCNPDTGINTHTGMDGTTTAGTANTGITKANMSPYMEEWGLAYDSSLATMTGLVFAFYLFAGAQHDEDATALENARLQVRTDLGL